MHFFYFQQTHLDLVVSGSILFAETYSIAPNKDIGYIRSIADKVKLPEFEPKKGTDDLIHVYMYDLHVHVYL